MQYGKVTFKQAIRDYWRGYVDFGGYTTRAGYWWANLFVWLYLLAALVIGLLCTHVAGIVAILVMAGSILSVILPNLALLVRRLRDAGLNNTGIITLLVVTLLLSCLGGISPICIGVWSLFDVLTVVATLLPSDALVGKTKLFCR